MSIAIIGLGYVGLSLATLLARKVSVRAVDIDAQKVAQVNNRQCPIDDADIQASMRQDRLDLTATTDLSQAVAGAEFAVVCTPTDFDADAQSFDTRSVDSVTAQVLAQNPQCCVIIKSTLPIGHVDRLRQRVSSPNIIFSPEFLREGRALLDNRYPSRIIVGEQSERARRFAALLRDASHSPNAPILLMDSREAEAVKLFANTYLAMRVAYFNELDSFALSQDLDPALIVRGVSLDPRVGEHYNNPSFGYGGYCLPKDSKQLLANYQDVPQHLMAAIVDANDSRMAYLARHIIAAAPRCIGMYRLVMKENSDNLRQSASVGLIRHLLPYLDQSGARLQIFEPHLDQPRFQGHDVVTQFEQFARSSDIIVSNRDASQLQPYSHKLFTRDLYGEN